MSDFLNEKGVLTVSIGEGFLSSFELGTLTPGDVIRSTQTPGRPFSLRFNEVPLASCAFYPIGDLFFAWVTTTERPSGATVEPGARDEVVELLPFTICGGSIRVSLQELRGVGANSLISLGVRVSTEEDVELQVLGIPVARGKLVVIDEEFGIRVTKVFGQPFADSNVRASGYLVGGSESAARVKDYDVHRPDRFTATTISRMAEIHRYFLRYASIRLPEVGRSLSMKKDAYGGVDQCTYGEWLAEISTGRFQVLAAENAPWRPRWGGRKGGETAPTPAPKPLVEAEDATVRVSPELREIIAGIFERNARVPSRGLLMVAYRTDGPLASPFSRPDVLDTLLDCLKGGWKNVANLNLRWPPPDDPLLAATPMLPESEMVITATLLDAGGAPALYLVYPAGTLDPLMGVLD